MARNDKCPSIYTVSMARNVKCHLSSFLETFKCSGRPLKRFDPEPLVKFKIKNIQSYYKLPKLADDTRYATRLNHIGYTF